MKTIKTTEQASRLILVAWINGMKLVGVPVSDRPHTKEDLLFLRDSLKSLVIKYGNHETESVLNAIRKHAEKVAIENAEKKHFPTFTIGDIHLAVKRYSSGPYIEKQLKTDGLTPEQREIEDYWNNTPPEEIARVKVPEWFDLISNGSGHSVTARIGSKGYRPEFRDWLLDQIDLEKARESARATFESEVVRMYSGIGFNAVKRGKTPNEIQGLIEEKVLKRGMSGGYVRDTFPNYEKYFIFEVLKQYQNNYLR